MKKLATEKDYGFVFIKLDDNPLSNKLLKSIETMICKEPERQICIFNSSNQKISSHTVPILHLNQSKFFYGNLFLFDIQSAIITKNYPNIYTRYFYATNIPWEKNLLANHREWRDVFDSPNLEVIAQNQHIADIYEVCWKKPILIAEDFTYEHIKPILG